MQRSSKIMITRRKLTAVAGSLVMAMGVSLTANASLVGTGFTVTDNKGITFENVASGKSKGVSWQARSTLIGSTAQGTGTSVTDEAGDALYHPTFPEYSGVVGILMDFGPGGAFVCSGTLLDDRRTIATAAHCVSSGAGTANPLTTTVFFQPEGGMDPGLSIYGTNVGQVGVEVADYIVHPEYTGEVIDQNDIALLTLEADAPEWAISHGVYTGELTGLDFNVAGYGVRGNGFDGGTAGTGRMREGDNMYDYAWGNEAFDGFFTDDFFGTAETEWSYVSDHDNGLSTNDQAGIIGQFFGTSEFNDTGLGDDEVGVAGGDSGGPNFIDGLLAGINSYGLTFGSDFGDATAGLDNSFGEFSGYVPTWIHADFIANNLFSDQNPVPSPAAIALLGLGISFLGWKKRK